LTDAWFDVRRLDDVTYLVGEPPHVQSYLVVGSERAVLFDTGMGVRDISSVVRGLTDRPILVVNSHHHFDHVGGNHLFEDIAIHESGAELIRRGPVTGWVESYWRDYEDVTGYAAAFVPSVATRLLSVGTSLDLGDRTLDVLHTPGHSVDSICLLDRETRQLFSADTADSGEIYLHLPTSDIARHASSIDRLAAVLAGRVDVIYGAHSEDGANQPALLDELLAAHRNLADGSVTVEATTDCFGAAAKLVAFGTVAFVVPEDYQPTA
jgi:glyoxylase-like metal-dependent hydrolase (beta-lactamase superfamily II)